MRHQHQRLKSETSRRPTDSPQGVRSTNPGTLPLELEDRGRIFLRSRGRCRACACPPGPTCPRRHWSSRCHRTLTIEDEPRGGSSRTRSLASTRMWPTIGHSFGVVVRRDLRSSFSPCPSPYPSSTLISWNQGQRRE